MAESKKPATRKAAAGKPYVPLTPPTEEKAEPRIELGDAGRSRVATPPAVAADSLWDKPGVADYVEGYWANPVEQGLRQAVADWVGKGDGDTLLDVGCGSARIAPMLKDYRYSGVDSSYELLRMAAERTKAAELVVHDLTKPLPFEDDEFDVVICLNVLRHLDSYEALVTEMARVAKRYVYIVDMFQQGGKHEYATSLVANQTFANNTWALPVFLADAARLTGCQVKQQTLTDLAWPVTGVRLETR